MPTPRADKRTPLERALDNPTLHPNALTEKERAPAFKWHTHCGSPRSSQVFCLSAFGTLRSLREKNRVLEDLFRRALPDFPHRPRSRRWEIIPEAERPELLGEFGSNQPTSVDALCVSSKEVICIESKFATDAEHGFGGCSQFSRKACQGYRGPGSDLATNTAVWCRLERWEGRRSPRAYWSIGTRYFQPLVLQQQGPGDSCPLRGPNYQLMRNFLFAASLAEKEGKTYFGVLAIAPRRVSAKLANQVDDFRRNVLLPEFQDRITLVDYETYASCLAESGDIECAELATFLEGRISEIIRT